MQWGDCSIPHLYKLSEDNDEQQADLEKLKPCPICGKLPKLFIKAGYFSQETGVILQCKSKFGKTHLIVRKESSESLEHLLEEANISWNSSVDLINFMYGKEG